MYSQPFAPTDEQPAVRLVKDIILNYVGNLYRSNSQIPMDQQTLMNRLGSGFQGLLNSIAAQCNQAGYYNQVNPQIAERVIASEIHSIITQFQAQQFGVGYQQPIQTLFGVQNSTFNQYSAPIDINRGLSLSNQKEPPAQQHQPQQVNPLSNIVNQSRQQKGAMTIPGVVYSVDPDRQFSTVEDDKASINFSIRTPSHLILDVQKRYKFVSDLGETFEFSKVTNYVNEPGPRFVINKFPKFAQKLYSSKSLVELKYNCFYLAEEKATSCLVIDTEPLRSNDRFNIPAYVTIDKVIRSITERNFNIVKVIDKLITNKFNQYSKMYLRHSDKIHATLLVEELRDIVELSTMSDQRGGMVGLHPDFGNIVLKCFTMAVNDVVTDNTKFGYYNTEEIVKDLIVAPNFVVRCDGILEREMDITNKDFITNIESRYTAFANNGNIVIGNFIPGELYDDIKGNIIEVNRITNILDHMILKVWSEPKTIVLRNNEGQEMIIRSVKSVDGHWFIESSDFDLDVGLRP